MVVRCGGLKVWYVISVKYEAPVLDNEKYYNSADAKGTRLQRFARAVGSEGRSITCRNAAKHVSGNGTPTIFWIFLMAFDPLSRQSRNPNL